MDTRVQTELKTFVDWIKIKARVHVLNTDSKFFHEREIWWAHFGHNVGSELNGKHDKFERPVVIFRKVSDTTFWALPISSNTGDDIFSHYIFTNSEGKPNAVIWTQIRLLSAKRLIRKSGSKLSSEHTHALKLKITEFLGSKTTAPPVMEAPRSSVTGAAV